MPQPKGFEPFTRIWTVNYKFIFQSSGVAAGTLLSRPRSLVFGSKVEADAAHDSLIAQSAPTVGHPAPGTIQAPFEENFYNKKTFIITWTNEHCAFVQVSAG